MTPNAKALAFAVVALLALGAAAPVLHAASLPTGSQDYNFTLQAKQREHYSLETFANTTVVFSAVSNVSVSTAFMTLVQFENLKAGTGGISDSVAYHNGTDTQETVRVVAGSYDIVVYAYSGRANITLSYAPYPNNPLSDGPLLVPEPSGIASFGLVNNSGTDTPYSTASTDVVGLASISSMDAYNSTAGISGSNPSGMTIQLNSVLVVNEEGGGSQVYWCQNTPDFVTAASTVAMADNLWNFSSSGFLSNETVTSEGQAGTVSTYQQDGATQYYYGYFGTNSSYFLPLGMTLYINATEEPGVGVLVQFGEHSTGAGSDKSITGGWFDNVTIHDPTATSAYFLTTGNATTPDGLYYDTELVFAGEENGESTSFSLMSSGLGLFYANGTSSTLRPFPSYFSFGYDTEEAADDLRMAYQGSGIVQVSVGTPNYDYLGTASGVYTPLQLETDLGFPGLPTTSSSTSQTPSLSSQTTTSSTSQTSTSGTTTTTTSSLLTTSSSSTTTLSSGGTTSTQSSTSSSYSTDTTTSSPSSTQTSKGGVPEFPYQFGTVVAGVAVISAAYLLARRRTAPRRGPSRAA